MRLNRKNKFLLLGFILTLYVCYIFSISNTISVYNEYNKKSKDVKNMSLETLDQLLQKEQNLDILLKSKIKNNNSFQNELLKQLNIYSSSYNLKIVDFKKPHIYQNKTSITTSYFFSIRGSFNNCLAMINKFDNNLNIGIIKHLSFIKKRNYKKNIEELTLEVVIQQNETSG